MLGLPDSFSFGPATMINKIVNCVKNWLFSDPRRIVRILVLIVCVFVVMFQLSECYHKLRHPPKSTHSHFDINQTMSYPALTFCRDPPYKVDVLAKYNLSYHPKFTSHWQRFPFEEATLEQVFSEGTYGEDEFFYQYGLHKNKSHVNLKSSLHFNYGRCHTLKPLVETKAAWKDVGYSILLKHDISTLLESPSSVAPGWHIFIHETNEPFSENRMQTSGRVEHMYVEVNEEVEIKLTVQHYTMMSDADSTCTNDKTYSSTRCGEICHWKTITDPIGCSGPWMTEVDMPQCDNYSSTSALINAYKNWEIVNDKECGCKEPCNSVIYSIFVLNRKPFNITVPSSQVYVFYTAKMVSIIEELPGYDLSQFVADMGGSLGFLLGLSVVGLIGIFERTTVILVGRFGKKEKPVPLECGKLSVETLIAESTIAIKEQATKPIGLEC